MEKKIVDVDYGIASSYDDTIEINRKLIQLPKLRARIIEHEQGHTNSWYNWKDFKNDFQSKDAYFLQSLIFAWKNPESLVNFFPYMYSYHFKEWTFNPSALTPLFYFGLLFVGTLNIVSYLAGFGLYIFSTIALWLLICGLGNLGVIFLAHKYIKLLRKQGREI